MKTTHANKGARLVLGAALAACVLAGCGGGAAAPANEPVTTPPPVVDASPARKPSGFFAMTGLNTPAADKAELLSLPYVSGMTSYVSWKELEPVSGQLNFSKLDADIALARSHGKKLTIGVFTGKNSIPDWLAAAGVKTWVTDQGNTLIHPTDQAFVALWRTRVQALGTRYGADDTVVQVTICGPAGTLCGPRYPELPPGVVYADLLGSWRQVIAAYQAAFPNTYKNLEVQLSANGWGAALPADLFADIALDVKIGPFAEFLSDLAPADGSTTALAFATAAKGRDWCGFQMVSPLGAKIGDAILRGRRFGCGYFEIYPADLKQQGAILAAALGATN